MSFAQHLQKQQQNIWLLHMTDIVGRKRYYYVQLSGIKKPIVERLVAKSGVNPADYGEILATGFGEQPSAEIAAYMKTEYGFEEAA